MYVLIAEKNLIKFGTQNYLKQKKFIKITQLLPENIKIQNGFFYQFYEKIIKKGHI